MIVPNNEWACTSIPVTRFWMFLREMQLKNKFNQSKHTLDHSNCKPRVLHRNFRNKAEEEIDLRCLKDSTFSRENFHSLSTPLLTSGLDTDELIGEFSSTRTLPSFAAVNKSRIGPYIALWFVLLGGCGKSVKLSLINLHCSSTLNAPGIK